MYGFLIAFVPRWPLAPEESVIALASLCCTTVTAEPQRTVGQLRAEGSHT